MSNTTGTTSHENGNDWDDLEDEVVESAAPSHLEVDTQEEVLVGALPHGGGSLMLSGPGAGTATEVEDTDQSAVIEIRSRDQALDGSEPLFMVHRPHQKGEFIPRLLATVLAATTGAVSTAATVALPSATTASHTDWLDLCGAASIKIADPLGYLSDPTIVRVKAVSDRSLRWAPYLAVNPLSVPDVLASQRAVGANLLLTSGRALDPTQGQTALDAAFAEGDEALALLEAGERLALNLTLPSQWLSNTTLRTALFSQLVDSEQFDVLHIRVQWSSTLRALHQPTDLDLLQGYKRFSQLAFDEERKLLLPQTGLSGWLQLAFGAKGYGAGTFGSGQAFKEHVQAGSGGQPPLERYFEPSILHSVDRSVHDVLRAQPAYVPCDCVYCPALHNSAVWNHDLARLHHLHWLGRLAGISASTGRPAHAAVRRNVRNAMQTAAGQPLAGISVPQHLQVWDQLL